MARPEKHAAGSYVAGQQISVDAIQSPCRLLRDRSGEYHWRILRRDFAFCSFRQHDDQYWLWRLQPERGVRQHGRCRMLCEFGPCEFRHVLAHTHRRHLQVAGRADVLFEFHQCQYYQCHANWRHGKIRLRDSQLHGSAVEWRKFLVVPRSHGTSAMTHAAFGRHGFLIRDTFCCFSAGSARKRSR